MLQSFIASECPSLCKLQVNYSILFHRSAWGTNRPSSFIRIVHALMIFCDRVVGEQLVPKKEKITTSYLRFYDIYLLKGDENWTVPAFSRKSVLYRFTL